MYSNNWCQVCVSRDQVPDRPPESRFCARSPLAEARHDAYTLAAAIRIPIPVRVGVGWPSRKSSFFACLKATQRRSEYAGMNRTRRIADIRRRIAGRRLIWFGVRGADAQPLLEFPELSDICSQIAPLGALSVERETCLEEPHPDPDAPRHLPVPQAHDPLLPKHFPDLTHGQSLGRHRAPPFRERMTRRTIQPRLLRLPPPSSERRSPVPHHRSTCPNPRSACSRSTDPGEPRAVRRTAQRT